MNVETNFRREPIRSRDLLDSAKGQPCTLNSPVCNRDPSTTVSCHVHDETFAFGEKADDCSTFYGCSACHAWLDQGQWLGRVSEAEMLRMLLRAVQRTMRDRILRKVMTVKLDKPSAPKPAKPRKPKDLRSKVGPSRPLSGGRPLTSGRKMEGRNDLRRSRS